MSSLPAPSTAANPLPTVPETPAQLTPAEPDRAGNVAPTSSSAPRASLDAPVTEVPLEGAPRSSKKDKQEKRKKSSKEGRASDKDSSSHKGSASKSSASQATTTKALKSPDPAKAQATVPLAPSASKRSRARSPDGGHSAAKRHRSEKRDTDGSRHKETPREPSDADRRPSDPRSAARASQTAEAVDTHPGRQNTPPSGSRPLSTFRHAPEDIIVDLSEPASPASPREDRRSPTPMPESMVHRALVHRAASPSPPRPSEVDYFYDEVTDTYYMAVPRDSIKSHSRPPAERPRPRASSRPSRAPSRVSVATDLEVVDLESRQETSSQAHYRPADDSDASSEDNYRPSNQEFAQPGAVSPSDDVRTFAEHVIKMGNALDIQFAQTEDEASDPIERRIHGKLPTPPAIPLLPSLEKLARRSWAAPASTAASNRKIESLYRVAPRPTWLLEHPRQNSAIVEGSQRASTPKASLMPSDREAKKIDALAKKAYFSSALGMRVANYNACMGAYIQWLMEKISPLIPDLPDDSQGILSEVRDEAHSIGSWIITSARHSTDCAAKSMSAAIALRRHAWLRSSDLNQNARSTIEDMSFDEDGLFHRETDEKLNFKYRMRTAAKKHGPVVCDDRPKGRLLPRQHPREPPQVLGLCRRDQRLQVQRPSLRAVHSPSSFHQVHGTCSIPSTSPGHQSLPVPGRLVAGGAIGPRAQPSHCRNLRAPAKSGTGREPREVSTTALQNHKVRRLDPRFKHLCRILALRPFSNSHPSHRKMCRPKKNSCQGRPGSPRTYGVNHIRNTVGKTPVPTSPVLVSFCLRPRDGPPVTSPHDPETSRSLPPLVARLPERLRRHAFFSTPARGCADHRRIRGRMGSPHHGLVGQGTVVPGRKEASHQCPGATGGTEGSKGLRILSIRQGGSAQDRQHHRHVLPEQTGRNQISYTTQHHTRGLGLVHRPEHPTPSSAPAGCPERPGGPSQQVSVPMPRVETPPRYGARPLQSVGNPTNRLVRDCPQHPLSPVLLPNAERTIPRGRVRVPLVGGYAVRVSPLSTDHQDSLQNDIGCLGCHPDHSVVAGTALVPLSPPPIPDQLPPDRTQTGSPHGSRGSGSTPGHRHPAPGSVEDPSLARLPSPVRRVILAAHKPATQKSYASKWNRFTRFLASRQLSPTQVTTPVVLDFLMSLIDSGLSLTSVKCYLSAICSSFQFNGKPSFFKDPLVVSMFHMCQDIVLPTLAPNPTTDAERALHTLDVRRALAFYLDRTRDSSRSERLFQCYSESKKRTACVGSETLQHQGGQVPTSKGVLVLLRCPTRHPPNVIPMGIRYKDVVMRVMCSNSSFMNPALSLLLIIAKCPVTNALHLEA
ncbi:uncharacterized protein LOC121933953 [Sceloporus undulatus]|uniref:uncharacterized protein LOC121933953 n=1 Tax=Sceloporus undulatus TaxID=8520 RepID=UPI001C4C9084|nr:uncharacterized protein LOC121933953 [Sceloporus undulatus]